jgi:Tol biopolymer transport system component
MTVGRSYSPERHDYQDTLTDRRVRQLADSPAEDYHLYFYNSSVTPDGRQVIFTSNRTGSSNVYLTDWE